MRQWQSIMDNLSHIFYLVRLIIRQVSIYLRDLILYKIFWMAANDEYNTSDSKLGVTLRNLTTDILAFCVICIVLFFLVLLASKCEKDETQLFTSAGIETVTVDLAEDPFCISNTSSSTTNCILACGDSIYPRGRIRKRNFSDEDMSRVRSCSKKRVASIPKKSIFGLAVSQPQNSQGTQTTDKIFQNTTQKWLIRRTRSGNIYGKYPI
ncbi:PREDICTED: uncharacterized protein LOC108551053 [Eufriesea mexicana]|uniref:uncharacterized protein LOC108551053 n=1 Tax=Eufriesea mexicana TaxID=516756 RepID=UPI00083C12C2|nr:PREDICTED: uncharacterized protein LOC108551053 [Eufriesea mexicana]